MLGRDRAVARRLARRVFGVPKQPRGATTNAEVARLTLAHPAVCRAQGMHTLCQLKAWGREIRFVGSGPVVHARAAPPSRLQNGSHAATVVSPTMPESHVLAAAAWAASALGTCHGSSALAFSPAPARQKSHCLHLQNSQSTNSEISRRSKLLLPWIHPPASIVAWVGTRAGAARTLVCEFGLAEGVATFVHEVVRQERVARWPRLAEAAALARAPAVTAGIGARKSSEQCEIASAL